ncbi:probable ATP-dependent (S)-NAD(P)H-hydrate dehydratase [Cephalotrichum gorgonifer]|uniref:ATP-dependent (S)-NAD(P)H-hydrate dehydratase n=1 Tax=Cephalotrichum gorgonifer TaxID=2041049 RepID=A0AAE8MPA7_9PEZI|nr:probable ATP-dependent (S)-NAD(P)H-hydrate dehydratase [Cephalotrichum gorgonifer]
MSSKTRELLSRARRMIPPMLERFHKGQLGRVAVIGGSEDYTGAPFFSAMASARLGCDMSHVICTPAAAAVIKTYSPNLMVHPLMRQTAPASSSFSSSTAPTPTADHDADPEHISASVTALLPRLHVLVVGPGLGRDPLMHATTSRVVHAARRKGIPLVLDADALLLVQKDPALVKGYEAAVLTPNVVEFSRLCEALGVDPDAGGADGGGGSPSARVEALARALGGVTIVQKGKLDYISNGDVTLVLDLKGGRKRSGGQGDTLTGSIATFLAWRGAYLQDLWDVGGDKLGSEELMGLAAFAGCAITKECSRLAFEKKGRSLQASDLTDEVHSAFLALFGEVGEDGEPKL